MHEEPALPPLVQAALVHYEDAPPACWRKMRPVRWRWRGLFPGTEPVIEIFLPVGLLAAQIGGVAAAEVTPGVAGDPMERR